MWRSVSLLSSECIIADISTVIYWDSMNGTSRARSLNDGEGRQALSPACFISDQPSVTFHSNRPESSVLFNSVLVPTLNPTNQLGLWVPGSMSRSHCFLQRVKNPQEKCLSFPTGIRGLISRLGTGNVFNPSWLHSIQEGLVLHA